MNQFPRSWLTKLNQDANDGWWITPLVVFCIGFGLVCLGVSIYMEVTG